MFGKLQKIWTVVCSDIMFPTFVQVCSADLDIVGSMSSSHHHYSMYVYAQNFYPDGLCKKIMVSTLDLHSRHVLQTLLCWDEFDSSCIDCVYQHRCMLHKHVQYV